MSIYEQALELGRQIANSDVRKKMMELERLVMADAETRKLVEELENLRQIFQNRQRMGGGFDEEDLQRLKKTEDNAMANPIVSNYYQSRTEFQQLANKVNAKMREGLNEGKAVTPPSGGGYGGWTPR